MKRKGDAGMAVKAALGIVIVITGTVVVTNTLLGSNNVITEDDQKGSIFKVAEDARTYCGYASTEGETPSASSETEIRFEEIESVKLDANTDPSALVADFKNGNVRREELDSCEYEYNIEGGASAVDAENSAIWIFTVSVANSGTSNPIVEIQAEPVDS